MNIEYIDCPALNSTHHADNQDTIHTARIFCLTDLNEREWFEGHRCRQTSRQSNCGKWDAAVPAYSGYKGKNEPTMPAIEEERQSKIVANDETASEITEYMVDMAVFNSFAASSIAPKKFVYSHFGVLLC